MKKNHYGFTVVETLFVLTFIVLISFVGWYVFNQNHYKNEQSNNSDKVSQASSNKSKDKTFSHKELSFTFEYPANWTTLDNTTDYGFYSVRLRAPGTVIDSCQGECLKSGAQILVLRNPVSTYSNVLIDNITKFKTSSVSARNLINTKTITVDGVEMLEYDNDSTSQGGTSLHGVQFYKNKIDYSFTLDNEQYTQEKYGSVFNNIVKSIKFN